MTNDKNVMLEESAESNGREAAQRSLSESESLSLKAKRSRYDELPHMMETVHESKKYHRLIEKRRRGRINECIYQLRDLMPADIIKPNSKPMEKAAILEVLVKYMQTIDHNNNKESLDGRSSSEYVRGYKECTDKVFRYLSSIIGGRQKEELKRHLQQEMTVTGKQNQSTTTSDLSLMPSNSTKGIEEYMMEDHCGSSSSFSLSSSMSDSSLCADNSDSSGYRDVSMNKIPKRKVYSHHHNHKYHHNHKSNNQRKRPSTSVASSNSSNASSPASVFINMPFMMSPNLMPAPQFIKTGTIPITTNTTSMPQLVQSFPSTVPAGMMVPQMGSDTNGVQYPTFFMACGQQQMTEPKPQQTVTSEPARMQPTVMMPVRSQGNFVFMPSYPMMPQFQAPTLVAMQTSTEEQTSPSE